MSDQPKGTLRFRCHHGEQSYEVEMTPAEVIDSAREFLLVIANNISNERGITSGQPILLPGTATVGLSQNGCATLAIMVNGLVIGVPLPLPQAVVLLDELNSAVKHLVMMRTDGTMTAH